MKFAIPDEIISQSKACMFGRACLNEDQCGGFPKCLIKYAISEDILMLEKKEVIGCPFCTDFGNGNFCTCPLRYAIFRRYNI